MIPLKVIEEDIKWTKRIVEMADESVLVLMLKYVQIALK